MLMRNQSLTNLMLSFSRRASYLRLGALCCSARSISKARLKTVAQLHALALESNDPIYLFICSNGGHVESGDAIYDAIRFIEAPVYTIGTGWVASAGASIYLAADKANRYSLPNTRYMLHQPLGGVRGSVSDIEITASEIIKVRERINALISEATGQPLDKVTKDTDRDYWMTAQEAKEYGLVNEVIQSVSELS